MDNDGDLDLIEGNSDGDSVIWHNQGIGTFTAAQTLTTAVQDIATADFNEDKLLDLFLIDTVGIKSVWLNQAMVRLLIRTGSVEWELNS